MTKFNRRTLMKAGFVSATGYLVGTASLLAEPRPHQPERGFIDAHSHIWTADLKAYPLAGKQTAADLDPPQFTDNDLLKLAATVGVTRVVLIQHHIYHGWDNRYLIDVARRRPQHFRVVGMLDDRQPHAGRKLKQLKERHVTGLRITPRIYGRDKWLSSAGMTELWQTAAKTRQAMCCLIDAEDLPAVTAMCRRHPETPVVIDHFARIGVDGKIREKDVQNLCQLARFPEVSVKLSAYYALGKKQPPYRDLIPMIRRVIDAFEPRRCMWASDAPYQMTGGNTYAASLQLIREEIDGLTTGDKDWLLRKTAARVFQFEV